MSGWRDRLVWANEDSQQRKVASFRGVPFFVRDSDRSIGRRNIIHQYPYRDIPPFIEDLGRDVDEFTIRGYVVQNTDNNQDYINERDALIEALRESGMGTLIHPFYGELKVSLLGRVRVEESFSQGGIARFTMTFVLAERAWRENMIPPILPSKKITIEDVDNEAAKSIDKANDSFLAGTDLEDAPGYAQNSFMNAIDSLNSMLRSVAKSVQGAFPSQVSRALVYLSEEYLGITVSSLSDACGLANSIQGMFNGLKSIVGIYGDLLSDQLLGACSGIVMGYYTGPMSGAAVLPTSSQERGTGFENSTMETPSKVNEYLGKTTVRAMLAVNGFGEATGSANSSSYGGTIPPVVITTYGRARQSANLIAIINLARINALTSAVQTAIKINYTSYDSAVEMMEEVVAELDAFLLKLGNEAADTDYDSYNITIASPGSYEAIVSLRQIFIDAMIGISASLTKIFEYEVPPTTISTLTLAYNKYSDLDREKEIIERNIPLIKHPGFLPGGKMIEVLSE